MRDMELIRALMLRAADYTGPDLTYMDLTFEGYEPRVVFEHIDLLRQAGFVEAAVLDAGQGGIADARMLKVLWAGYDFVDAARNETVWKRAMKVVRERGGSIPMELLKTLLTQIAAQYFKI